MGAAAVVALYVEPGQVLQEAVQVVPGEPGVLYCTVLYCTVPGDPGVGSCHCLRLPASQQDEAGGVVYQTGGARRTSINIRH